MPTERGRGEDTKPPYSEPTTLIFYHNAEGSSAPTAKKNKT